ncbi:probable E3 ubiquitin-protein ligase RNF217 isoform X2 [Polyodon spathula]|uniref:probable E3 ubiquitin-protein ligase RNF217 isoform X2 n=1 Tax=Polyodon spathula TaxID=7913 RepID=UPI001B7EC47B|nr:probable E3 ubiquitin-protein ligase RNF217 isoform X2 [Polyodon spathula]
MEDEQISVNVIEKEMPSIDSKDLDLENSRNSEEESVDIGIENADFVNNGQQMKVIQPDVVLDVQTHRLDICVDQDELSDQEIVRKPTAVDILKKGFGTSNPTASNTIDNINKDDQKERRDVSVDVILKRGTDQQGNCTESGIKSELCIEHDHENVEKNVTLTSDDEVKFTCTESETDYVTYTTSTIQSKGNEETFQSKGHVYCTVHCMKNDNYRRSPLDSLGEQPREEGQITASSPVINHTRVDLHPQTETELDLYYNEPFNISSLIDSNSLGTLYSGDYNPFIVLTCRVCLEDKHIKPLHCCKKAVCEECLKRYLSSQVQLGQVDVKCPIPECSAHLEESMVVAHLPNEEVVKYKYFLELSRVGSSTKPCPQCQHFTTFKKIGNVDSPSKAENKYKILCEVCQLVWCFKCHSPWHEGLNCRDYKKGDKLLRHWASEIEHGQRNAQKCPRCKIHIQRTEGCDHMTCSQCNTNFCYRCGERYRQLRFFGDHTSNLSIFGCKFRYLPEKPHLRRLVRGSVCGLIVFPIYYLCKRHRKRTHGSGRWFC